MKGVVRAAESQGEAETKGDRQVATHHQQEPSYHQEL